MKLEQNRLDPIPKTDNEITVIFLRGNGIPRTFKLTIDVLRRGMFLFSGVFGLVVLIAIVCFTLFFFSSAGPTLNPLALPKESIRYVTVTATATSTATDTKVAATTLVAAATVTVTITATQTVTGTATKMAVAKTTVVTLPTTDVSTASANSLSTAVATTTATIPAQENVEKKPGILAGLFPWSKATPAPTEIVTPKVSTGPSPQPQQLIATDGKPDLSKSIPSVAPLLTEYAGEGVEATVKIRNVKVFKDLEQNRVTLTFELQNTHPEQRQARGHIVVFAKSESRLLVYPRHAYAPKTKKPLNFHRGDTFAISYGRQATATFQDVNLETENFQFQIVLFTSDGKIIASETAENQ